MNFFTSKIVTKPISLEEAVKNSQAQASVKPRTLDEIIASGKAIKTASSQAEVKTAAVIEPPKVEVKPEIKVAMAPLPVAKKPLAKPVAVPVAPVASGQAEVTKAATEAEKAIVGKPVAPVAKAPMVASKKVLKIASSLDFRGWEAQAVIDAWSQHKNMEGCVKNVAGSVSDPKTYCSLLSVAASEAPKFVKTAKTEKVAWKKIAKLTEKERSRLKAYWLGRGIYNQDYVDAMLGDY